MHRVIAHRARTFHNAARDLMSGLWQNRVQEGNQEPGGGLKAFSPRDSLLHFAISQTGRGFALLARMGPPLGVSSFAVLTTPRNMRARHGRVLRLGLARIAHQLPSTVKPMPSREAHMRASVAKPLHGFALSPKQRAAAGAVKERST